MLRLQGGVIGRNCLAKKPCPIKTFWLDLNLHHEAPKEPLHLGWVLVMLYLESVVSKCSLKGICLKLWSM